MWIENTINAVISSVSGPKSLTVMCTARSKTPEIVYVTNNLLRLKGLKFDQNCLYYKPLRFSGSTSQYKTEIIERLLNSYSYAKEVNFWEDNQQNLNAAKYYIDQNNKYNTRQIQFNPILVSV